MFVATFPGSRDSRPKDDFSLIDLSEAGQEHALVEPGGDIVGVKLDAAIEAYERLLVEPLFFLQPILLLLALRDPVKLC